MLSQRQRIIVVEMTLASRTAWYIADRFDISISIIQWIRQRYMETGRWQVCYAPWTSNFQTNFHRSLHDQTIYSHVAVQKLDISFENRLWRWCWAPEPLTGPYQTIGPAYLSPMNQCSALHIVTGGWWYGEQSGRNIYPNDYAWSIEIESSLATMVLAIPSFSMKRECRQFCQKIVRRPSWFSRKHFGRQKSSCFNMIMLQSRRGVKLSHDWSSRIYPKFNGHPSPWNLNNITSLGFYQQGVVPVTRNDLIRVLYNSWLNITVLYLQNLYKSLPRRIRAVIMGRGYPKKYWLTK